MVLSTLFRRDDALVLGVILSRFFHPPFSKGDYNFTIGFPWGFVFGGLPSTGAGGGIRGDNGKPIPSDGTPFSESYPSLSGYGASQEAPGKGFQDGKFGIGGGYSTVIPTISCGGGSGWFGGGSGYIGAGGGGGSGYVNTIDSYKPVGYNPPDEQFFALPGSVEYKMGVNEGHGFCLINGIIRFDYTGKVQTYTVPVDGIYTIECYGAQGGGLKGLGDKYSGGKGGYAKGEFYFKAGTVLYIYVGEEGRQTNGLYAWNGGGAGLGGAFSGGGATDVRWSGEEGSLVWMNNLYDRFIVAGGGGGVGFLGSSNLNHPLPPNISPNGEPYEKEIKTQPTLFVISDLTICTVSMDYKCSLDLSPSDYITVKLYVDDVLVGTYQKNPRPGGGLDEFAFDFSDWLPPNTPPYWAKIYAEVETNIPLIIPPSGLRIQVSTKTRPNDVIPEDKPVLQLTREFFKAENLNILDVLDILLERKEEPVDDVDNIVDIVTVEEVYYSESVGVFTSDIVDDLSVVDYVTYTKVNILRYDSFESSIKLEDIILIEGGGQNLDTLLEELGLRDVYAIDLRDRESNSFDSTNQIEDFYTLDTVGIKDHEELDSLTVNDEFDYDLD